MSSKVRVAPAPGSPGEYYNRQRVFDREHRERLELHTGRRDWSVMLIVLVVIVSVSIQLMVDIHWAGYLAISLASVYAIGLFASSYRTHRDAVKELTRVSPDPYGDSDSEIE